MKPQIAVITVATYILDRMFFSPLLLVANSSWNINLPSLVPVSREVRQKQETASMMIVFVAATAPAEKPITSKKLAIAVPKITVGEIASRPSISCTAACVPLEESVPIAIREITASTHSISMEP